MELSAEMEFSQAFRLWMEQRTIEWNGTLSDVRYVAPRTIRDWRQVLRSTEKFFGRLRLGEIRAGHFREYQRARALNRLEVQGAGTVQPWAQPAGANLIRREVTMVKRILRAAGAWRGELEDTVQIVRAVENDVPRAMTPEEQHRLLHVAASRPEWDVVLWWAIVALQTTASTNELRAIRLGDVFLEQEIVQIRNLGAKNTARVRTIPLQTPEIVWALRNLMARARQLGANGPHCFLFPVHVTADRYDPMRPMTEWGLRKRWEAVRAEAGLPWLRMYDTRHAGITRMAEAGVPIQVIMSFAGHLTLRMQQHYTAISMQAKRRWAAAAWAGAEMPWTPMPARKPVRSERDLMDWRRPWAMGE